MSKINSEALMRVLVGILRNNAPVRSTPGRSGMSPFPGNLKQNGIYTVHESANEFSANVGGEHAPYAIHTEERSRKKGWMEKSNKEFVARMLAIGGRVK